MYIHTHRTYTTTHTHTHTHNQHPTRNHQPPMTGQDSAIRRQGGWMEKQDGTIIAVIRCATGPINETCTRIDDADGGALTWRSCPWPPSRAAWPAPIACCSCAAIRKCRLASGLVWLLQTCNKRVGRKSVGRLVGLSICTSRQQCTSWRSMQLACVRPRVRTCIGSEMQRHLRAASSSASSSSSSSS